MPIYSAQFPKEHNPAAAQNLMGLGVVSDDGPKFVRRVTRAGSKLTRAGVSRSELPFWHPDYLPGEGDLDLRLWVQFPSIPSELEALENARIERRHEARIKRNIERSIAAEKGLRRGWGWLMRELLAYDARERGVEDWRRGARGKAKAIVEGRTPWPRELLIWRGERETALICQGKVPPWLDPRNLTKPQREALEKGAP